jgi:hypothetical protein
MSLRHRSRSRGRNEWGRGPGPFSESVRSQGNPHIADVLGREPLSIGFIPANAGPHPKSYQVIISSTRQHPIAATVRYHRFPEPQRHLFSRDERQDRGRHCIYVNDHQADYNTNDVIFCANTWTRSVGGVGGRDYRPPEGGSERLQGAISRFGIGRVPGKRVVRVVVPTHKGFGCGEYKGINVDIAHLRAFLGTVRRAIADVASARRRPAGRPLDSAFSPGER